MNMYLVHIQMGKQIYPQQEIEVIKKQITDCLNYLNSDNMVNGRWLENNHSVLCKAIKCSHDNYRDSYHDGEEIQTLNKLIIFYRNLYEQMDLNFDSVVI